MEVRNRRARHDTYLLFSRQGLEKIKALGKNSRLKSRIKTECDLLQFHSCRVYQSTLSFLCLALASAMSFKKLQHTIKTILLLKSSSKSRTNNWVPLSAPL